MSLIDVERDVLDRTTLPRAVNHDLHQYWKPQCIDASCLVNTYTPHQALEQYTDELYIHRSILESNYPWTSVHWSTCQYTNGQSPRPCTNTTKKVIHVVSSICILIVHSTAPVLYPAQEKRVNLWWLFMTSFSITVSVNFHQQHTWCFPNDKLRTSGLRRPPGEASLLKICQAVTALSEANNSLLYSSHYSTVYEVLVALEPRPSHLGVPPRGEP